MYNKIYRTLKNLNRGEKGMTGLETAIILIAFVTVASVLAYTVLSAGIFAAERGKATVYQGLQQAQSTMSLKSSVIGLSTNGSKLESVIFSIGLAIPNQKVDMNSVVFNYWDENNHAEGLAYTATLATGCAERGTANMLEGDEQFTVTVTLPAATNLVAYNQFNIQIAPPTGASITITRTLPGTLLKVMELN